MRWARRAAGAPALLGIQLAAAGVGCLRPSEERALQDLEVGQAEGLGLRVEVEDGHAAVRRIEGQRLRLWAAAPSFDFGLHWSEPPPSTFLVEVHNCMPGATVAVRSGAAELLSSRRSAAGVCNYLLAPATAELGLGLTAPQSAEPSPFRFAVLSDVQEALPDVQDIYALVNQQPDVDFLLGAGDLTEQGTREQLERFQLELEQLDIPYYTTLGNHELGEDPTLYHEYFGRGSQSFVHKGVRFTLLDSASATLDPIVFDWLDGWLELGARQAHVVAMHIAPLDPIGVRNGAFASRNEAGKLLARLAAARVDVTIYGHVHSYYSFENAGIPAYISGGGGAIPERFDDIGRHFLVVDADPAGQRFDVSVVRVD